MSYIIRPNTINIEDIFNNEFSLSSSNYRFIKHKNENIYLLGDKDILLKNEKGFEPGSKEYIDFSNNYFVRISDMDDLSFSFDLSKNTLKVRPVKNKNRLKFINKGDICYQTASNVGNVCFYDGEKAFYNSHIRKLEFKRSKYYIFAILKSRFGKEQINVSASIKGVDNFKEDYLLNTKIPFPTIKNNSNPNDVEKLVSLIVQNIIDKERQIRIKNNLIDKFVEREIKENQKLGTFCYYYPKIDEIREKGRLDTGLYDKQYKKINFLIKNYCNGYFKIPFENIKTGQTPKDYYYVNEKKNDNVYLWITPSNLSKNIMKKRLWIHTKKNNTLQDGDIIFGSRGTVGDLFYYDKEELGRVYINQSTSGIKIEGEVWNKIFVLCYFSSSFFKRILSKYIFSGTVPAITPDVLTKFLIPKFPEKKQKVISKFYYNKVTKNTNLDFENYLEKEMYRNKKVGIFQLNMEIFALREILDKLVHAIVMDEYIDINFQY